MIMIEIGNINHQNEDLTFKNDAGYIHQWIGSYKQQSLYYSNSLPWKIVMDIIGKSYKYLHMG